MRLGLSCFFIVSSVLAGCASLGNSTFAARPAQARWGKTTLSSIEESFESIYTISGEVTAVSREGIISGKVSVSHGKGADRVTIVSRKGSLIADAFIIGSDILFQMGKNATPRKELLSSWMHIHLGAGVPIETALSWMQGHPHGSYSSKIDTDDPKRQCFLEEGWLVCIQQPEDHQENIKRVVQLSIPSVNINLLVYK